MAYDNNYKTDIDINRTDRFSSLYVIISKIGLGCVTYFMVGLVVSLIYVLSDMDYFTLNGQFRNQRFFTDDGYYYTKQLVIIYGLLAFIITMFIGPVGIIPCIIWSWLLTISYISMSVYMNSTNPDTYNKLLIRFIGFVSFVSHSLLCNFIFYLFYPMNSMFSSYVYDYDIKLTNSINNSNNNSNNNNNSRNSYTFYRILSFMSGYFIGCSLLSFVLSIKTDMRDSLYPINNHNNVMKLLLAMLIASSISMLTSLLLSFQFIYEFIIRIRLIYKYSNNSNSNYNSNVTNSHNDLIDKSRYMLDSGAFVWFPINKHTNNVISKNFHTIIDIEMLFVWILNPFIITLIPYNIPSHFQFKKQSYIHKLLFSLIFIIIFMFLNDDLIFSYLFPNEYINSSVFNIIYSNQYIQLKDDHLYLNPVSISNINYFNCGFNTNSNFDNINIFNNTISSVQNSHSSFVSYPHFDDIWDYLDNEHVLLSSFIYEIFKLLHISQNSVININSSIYQFYSINSLSFTDQYVKDDNELYIYYYIEYNYDIMSISLNPVNNLFSQISNISISFYGFDIFYDYKLLYYVFLNKISSNDINYLKSNIVSIDVLISSVVSLFETTYKLILTDQEDISNLQFTNSSFLNKLESKDIYPFVLNLLSTATLTGLKLITLFPKYADKAIKILKILGSTDYCSCVHDIKNYYTGFYTITQKTYKIDLNPYSSFNKIMLDRVRNHLCICFLIMHILRPNILMTLRFIIDSILDLIYTSNKRFDKNSYSNRNEQLIVKFILMLFDTLYKIVDWMETRLLFLISYSRCFCIKNSDPYYGYFVSIILYISYLLQCMYVEDYESIEKSTKKMSNLLSMLKYSNHEIELKVFKTFLLKKCEFTCRVFTEKCLCRCKGNKQNKCCCIICRNIKIISLTICLGCQVCCLCCDQSCHCHTNAILKCQCDEKPTLNQVNSQTTDSTKSFFYSLILPLFSLPITLEQIKGVINNRILQCPCQQICSLITGIKKCTEKNGCAEICKKIKELFNGPLKCKENDGKCICQDTCDKIHELPVQCTSFLVDVKNKIKEKIKCDDGKKCCCKITLSSIYCLQTASICISYYLYNEAIMQCLDCCKEVEDANNIFLYNTNNLYKIGLITTNYKNALITTNYKNALITTKNNRICDSMSNSADKTDCCSGNNIIYGNSDIYNNKDNNNRQHSGHKLKQSRVFIALGLIFLILCLRMSFDISNDDNNNKHIYKSNNKLMGQHIQNNNLLGSMYNIFVNNNMKQENNEHGQYYIKDNNNTNYSNIKQNKMMYFMTMLVSLISALYMNMVIRNMYDKLKLEYDIWSYLINMILMTGMMSSLISKYSVHIFDFVGVLDKYGMNLSKDGILLNVVEGNKIIDDVNAPVKNMMMYGLFKSMTKDLSSLIRYTDKTTTTSSKTTYSKMRNKLYPYKEMSKPIHRITKYCDKCQHSLCKIHISVINNLGNDKSIDIVSVLDFLSYTMIYNHMSFINQYESYFNGDELYMIWKLNKFVNNNMFVTEYYRHQTLNKIEQEIKQLINSDNKLGSYNLMLLWEIFGENEIRNITLKSMSDINDQQMIQNQRDILSSFLYNEYLKDFYNFQEYVCNTYLNTKLVTRSESLNVNNITEFTHILNKHILDKSTIQHLANIYSKNTHNRKIKSLMLPTVSCNITGNKDQINKNVKSYCNDWLKYKLLFCKHIKSPYCEEAVNIAYYTIYDLANKPGNLYKNILDLLTNLDLSELNTLFEQSYHYSRKLIKPMCKDCESMSLYYINQYLSESLVNIDRMLRPLGMYLSWNGTPILSQHLYKYGHKY